MSPEILSSIPDLLSGILLSSGEIFVEAAPYLIFGFAVAGILNVLVPDQKIVDYLGTSAGKIRSVINASLAGLPLPLCSCGVIPAAMSIRKRGANRGATLSFLISTPQTGVDSIAITYALLDPLMTVFRPLATLATALLAGLADNLLIGEEPEKEGRRKEEKHGKREHTILSKVPSKARPLDLKNGLGEKTRPLTLSPGIYVHECVSENSASSCGCDHCGKEKNELFPDERIKKSVKEEFVKGLKYAFIELPGEISKWMLIGILLAGIISYAVPETLIQEYLGGGLMSMLVMLVVGIPLYICATASTPLAASLVAKGMSPGTAFVFLLAGPATNAATITMVARFLGKRSAALYLGVISLCALGAGLILDWLYLNLGISATATLGSAGELLPESMKLGFAAALLPLMIYGVFRREQECSCTECH